MTDSLAPDAILPAPDRTRRSAAFISYRQANNTLEGRPSAEHFPFAPKRSIRLLASALPLLKPSSLQT